MKNTILTLITIISFNVYSQNNEIQNTPPKWMSNTPGKELIKASNHYYLGFGITTAGFGAIALGNFNGGKNFIIGGGILAVAGSIFIVESQIHFKRAGLLLDQNGIGLKIKI
jgi:hypothetical protein